MRERYIIVNPPVQEQAKDPSLLESLGEKKFIFRHKVAINILDELDISLSEKRTLFFYLLWHETGSFAPIKEFGDIHESPKIDSILDSVMLNPKILEDYARFYDLFEKETSVSLYTLISRGYLFSEAVSELGIDAQVMQLKKQKVKHVDIAKKLGIRKVHVDRISKELIAQGLMEVSPRGKTQALKFAEFLNEVEKIDDPKLSDKEIADKMIAPLHRVEKARKRLRLQKRIKKRTPKDVAQSQQKSRNLLPLRDKIKKLDSSGKIYTESEVARITGATMQQVKHQRVIIRREAKEQ